ncbi:hypothetical protein DFH11DRAFT_1617273 [Phellopilus nigrolimitatus]|nr:hypothetical protein DFH11DRAFT_1617273 [Phellopilus nigrolimitatus]
MLTFSEERRLVWSSRLSIIKVAFFLNRYMPFVGLAGMMHVTVSVDPVKYAESCRPAFIVFSSFIVAEYVVAEFILYMRAYAVWGCSRLVSFILGSLYIVFCTLALYFSGQFLKTVTTVSLPLLPTGCLVNLRGDIDRLAMSMLMVMEAFALAALLGKAAQMPHSTMMKRIFTDGIIYFIIILFAAIANIIVLSAASPVLSDFMLAPQCALHSICCSRLLLRIRGAYTSLSYTTLTYTSLTVSMPSFPHSEGASVGESLPLSDRSHKP